MFFSRFGPYLLRALIVIFLATWLAGIRSSVALSTPLSEPPVIAAEPAFVPGELLLGWAEDADCALQVPECRTARVARRSDVGPLSDRAAEAWTATAEALTVRTGLTVLDVWPDSGWARLAVPAGTEREQAARLMALPWVAYAEPNYLAHAAEAVAPTISAQALSLYPNDPFIADQWYLRRIAVPEAWDVTRGSVSLILAVIDAGVDLNHPEFAGRLLPGYDFVNRDDQPNDDTADGHGTHVAGLAAATADNAIGIAGVAPAVKLLPFKVLDRTGNGTYADIAAAIELAANRGAQIINLSLGGFADGITLRTAVNYAIARNVLVVAAAGNCALGGWACNYNINPDYYPAAYPGVLAVAATDHYDQRADYSGYKPYIGIAAPGGLANDRLWSTVPGGYGFNHGTSMATPLVAGSAALVWTMAPGLSAAQVADTLRGTADKVGTQPYINGRNDFFGHGRLNSGRAVRLALTPSLSRPTASQLFVLGVGSQVQRNITVLLTNPSEQPVLWRASVIEGSSWLTLPLTSGVATFSNPSNLILRAGPTSLAPGAYDGIVRVEVVSPPATPFNIPVLLRVTDLNRRAYLPMVPKAHQLINWINPLEGGTPLNLGDNSARQLLLPFPVRFFGRTYNEIWVNDNGIASFGQPYAGSAYNTPGCLPSAASPNDAIYVLWQDLAPQLGGQIYVQQPDAQQFVITWYQVPRADGAGPQTFQLILLRNGRILLQYLTLSGPFRATIGIENFDGTLAQQIACAGTGQAPATDAAFVLTPATPW